MNCIKFSKITHHKKITVNKILILLGSGTIYLKCFLIWSVFNEIKGKLLFDHAV
jgi:hypothetical protein